MARAFGGGPAYWLTAPDPLIATALNILISERPPDA